VRQSKHKFNCIRDERAHWRKLANTIEPSVCGGDVALCQITLTTCYRHIARSARRRYLSYAEADFEVFRPAGATRCTDGVKFGTEQGIKVPSALPNFNPVGATIRYRTPKTEIFTEI